MISSEDYLQFVHEALTGMAGTLTDLGDELASRRPELPDANSPFAILTHCLGVMEYWAGHVVAGRSVDRDRAAEFRATGAVEDLLGRVSAQWTRFVDDVAQVDPFAPPRGAVSPDDATLPLGRTQGGALLHVYKELVQHRGQLEITADVLRGSRTDVRPVGSARQVSWLPEQLAVAVGAVTLGVRVWPGADPSRTTVVLLPATGETAEDWDAIASFLQPSRTVHAVSLRGHGPSDWPGDYSIQSMADDVTGLLQQLGDAPVDLVGHSLGGLVACAVASTHPELVRRLVLEDVGVPHSRSAAPPSRPAGDLPFDWQMVEQVRPEIDDPDPRWSDVLARIPAPTLVIAGGPSSPVPQEHIAELVGTLPDGRLVTVDAGHLVHATRPDEFSQHLLTFLDARLAAPTLPRRAATTD